MKKYITLEKARDIVYNNSTTNWFVESINDDEIVQTIIKINDNYYAFYYSKGITKSDDTINTKEEYDINLYWPTYEDQLEYHVEIAPVEKVITKSHVWKGI
ncbi:hypothetical protein ATCCB_0005 [Lactobacillus phage ATCCB]|nr:hypothetical protein ATCCB_0005 [Lactobacillus phage ATCCB]